MEKEEEETAMKDEAAIGVFLDITRIGYLGAATYFLKESNWNLEEALHLFYISQSAQLPERKDTVLNLWESNTSDASTSDRPKDGLASLYRKPLSLMYKGSFEMAREEASSKNKWLIVNLQSATEFSSHLLNRDTWSEETIEETIQANFIFWQVYDDDIQYQKVCNFYKVASFPAILIIDPITGQRMRALKDFIGPQDLLEILLSYAERCPKECLQVNSRKHSMEKAETSSNSEADKMSGEDAKDAKPTYLPLPDEPNGANESLCKVGVRFPDGRRIQRNFLITDPVKLLWSFCASRMEEEESVRSFSFTRQFPPRGASKSLDIGSNATFEQEKLSCSLLSLVWL